MTARRKSLNARLGELEQAVVEVKAYERDVERDHLAAQAEVARISEARVEAFATQDEKTAEALAAERANAERTVAEFAERAEGARRAVVRAEVGASTFARENLDALLQERLSDARKAVKAVKGALDALQAAHSAWLAVESESMRLLRLAGQNTTSQPRFPASGRARTRRPARRHRRCATSAGSGRRLGRGDGA